MTIFTEVNPRTFLPLEGSQTMPRTKATAETLEHQAAADSKLGDLDEAGNERLPEFSTTPRNGVRPSEQCRTPSHLGIGCTFEAFHVGGHSWQPGPHEFQPSTDNHTLCEVCASTLGKDWHIKAVEQVEQPALPGTPEPEQNEFTIPREAEFKGADYQSAPGIKAIAERLIADTEEFGHLVGIEIRYFWKRRGGRKGGNPNLGSLQKAIGRSKYALGNPVYFLDLSADHCREAKFTDEQLTALVFDRLARAAVDPEDHSAYRVMGADFEGMALTVARFGLWNLDLREGAASLRQLPLDQELALPDADEGEDDEADE